MANLPVSDFFHRLSYGDVTYVVMTRREHDGGISVLLYEGADGIDDMPPLMLLSDAAGDQLRSRISRAQPSESEKLAAALLTELLGELNSAFSSATLRELVHAFAAWIDGDSEATGDIPALS